MSCAPNVAKKFTQVGDKSHHRDAFRQDHHSPSFRSGRPQDGAEREFRQFNQPNSEWGRAQAEWQSPAHAQVPVQAPLQAPSQALRQPDAWVNQFQAMNVNPQMAPGHAPGLTNPMNSPLAHTPLPFAPRFAYSEAPTFAPTPAPAPQRDFEQAFEAAEHRMSALTGHINPQDSHEAAQSQGGLDLQGIAKGVISTIENTTTSEKMAEKMRNSNFMNLMLQLSSKQAVVKENNIVPSETAEAAPAEWQGPKVAEVEIKQPIYQERLRDPVGGQQPEEDVEEYLQRIGTPEKPHESGILSPFEAANLLGPEKVRLSDWEEDYSQWVQ